MKLFSTPICLKDPTNSFLRSCLGYGLFLFLLLLLSFHPVKSYSQALFNFKQIDENNGLNKISIRDIAFDKNGLLWIINDGDLLSFDGTNFQKQLIIINQDTLLTPSLNFFYTNNKNDLFIASHLGLFKIFCENGSSTVRLIENKFKDIEFIFDLQDVNRLTKSIDYMFLTYKGYLITKYYEYYFDQNNIFSNKIGDKKHKQKTIELSNVRAYIEQNDSVYFFLDSAIYCYVNGNKISEHKVYLNGSEFKLPKDYLFRRIYGFNFLLCRDGVFELNFKNKHFELEQIISNEKTKNDYSYSLACNMDKSIMALSTPYGGLTIYKNNSINVYNSPGSFNCLIYYKNKLIPNNHINFAWELSGQNTVISAPNYNQYGTTYGYIKDSSIVMMESDELIKFFPSDTLKPIKEIEMPLFGNNFFNRIVTYHDTVYLFSGLKAGYIFKDKYVPIEHPKTSLEGAVYDAIIINDTVWFAWYKGVSYYPLKTVNPKFTQVIQERIRRIIPEKNGRGLFFIGYGTPSYLRKDNQLFHLPKGPDGILNFFHDIIIDRFNRAWMPNNKGLVCTDYEIWFKSIFDPSIQPYYYTFGKEDGLSTLELNGGNPHSSVYLPNKDLLFFSSIKGLIRVNANKDIIRFPSSKIGISSTEINGKVFNGVPEKITTKTTIRLNLSCPYWGNKQNLLLEYKWDSDDENWTPILNSYVLVDRPGPGSRDLLIRFRDGFGLNEYNTQRFSFYYELFWYEHWYTQLLAVFLFLLIIYLSVQFRTRYLLEKQKELELIVKQKTIEIQTKVDELTISELNLLESDSMREKLIRVLAHDIRSPLKSITHVTNYTIQKLSKLNDKTVQDSLPTLNEIALSIDNLFHYSSDFLTWYNLKQFNGKPVQSFFKISQLLEKSLAIYAVIIKESENKLQTQVDDSIVIFQDFEILNIIVRNLLDNANKYTDKSTIYIEIGMRGNLAYFLIKNKVSKLTPQLKNSIQSKFSEEVDIKANSEFKVGLNLVSFLIKKLDIKIEINFPENAWVEYVILIPDAEISEM